jgi:hypothetical protein
MRLISRPARPASFRQRCKAFSSASLSASRAILIEGGEGSAWVKMKVLRHRGAPSVAVEGPPVRRPRGGEGFARLTAAAGADAGGDPARFRNRAEPGGATVPVALLGWGKPSPRC